ncbi:btk-binding protein-related [Anaeramoeba flamelloides]|uniref:Btk-binding protein-related n=1 Tax=Anaeramoeba flamelloides TaxID=1746091 RepID=A0AAV7YNF8_9EUKA|nr:btk-binding protein-related [Anaeramoeba flamelloides]
MQDNYKVELFYEKDDLHRISKDEKEKEKGKEQEQEKEKDGENEKNGKEKEKEKETNTESESDENKNENEKINKKDQEKEEEEEKEKLVKENSQEQEDYRSQRIYYPIEIAFGSCPDIFVSHQSILLNNRIYVVGYHEEHNTMLYTLNPITNCCTKLGITSRFKCDCATLFATRSALISFGEKNLIQFKKDLNRLYKSEEFSDLILKTKDGAIKVQRLWIKIRWEKFVYNEQQMRELIQQNSTKVMNSFFQYLYSDTFKRPKKIKAEELDYIFDLISFSNEVGIERLAGLVTKWLRERMSLEVVFDVLQTAQKYQCSKIVNFCLCFLFFHRHSVIESKSTVIQQIKDHQLQVKIKRNLGEICSPYVRYTLGDISEDQDVPSSTFKRDILRLMSDKKLENNQTKNDDDVGGGGGDDLSLENYSSGSGSGSGSGTDSDSDSNSNVNIKEQKHRNINSKNKIPTKKGKYNLRKSIIKKFNQLSRKQEEINFKGSVGNGFISDKGQKKTKRSMKRKKNKRYKISDIDCDSYTDDDFDESGDSDENNERSGEDLIKKERSMKYFNILMRVIYALDFELDFNSAQLLLNSQKDFGLHFNLILLECIKIIKKSLNEKNCLSILKQTIKYNLPLLQDYVLDKLINQFPDFLITEKNMKQLSPQICKKILLKLSANEKNKY